MQHLPIIAEDGRTIERLTGDDYYMHLAHAASMRSRDPSTKVGAVIVRHDQVVGTGYNGFPRGVPDSLEWLEDRETKLTWTVHAEVNAILHAGGRSGCDGATLYVTPLFPCKACALTVVASGMKRVVYRKPAPALAERWAEHFEAAKTIFRVAGVELYEWHDYRTTWV